MNYSELLNNLKDACDSKLKFTDSPKGLFVNTKLSRSSIFIAWATENSVPIQKIGPYIFKIMAPKFKDLTFDSSDKFEQWLNNNTHFIITFLDLGQDLLRIHVAENREIINCNLQGNIWNGNFIQTPIIGDKLHLWKEAFFVPYNFTIESFTKQTVMA